MKPDLKIVPKEIWECPGCGASTDAPCSCNVPPRIRAAQAIAANPEKSDRIIAKELGVGSNTVRRARAAPSGAPEKRQGRDGKSYPASRGGRVVDEDPTEITADTPLRVNDPRAPLTTAPDPDLLNTMTNSWEACLQAFKKATPAQRSQFRSNCKYHSKDLIVFMSNKRG